MAIKFNLFNVTNGTLKASVHYSHNTDRDGVEMVTLYARGFDCGRALCEMFGADVYTNNTDMQSDVFDKGHITLRPGHALFAAASAAADRKANRPRGGRRVATCAPVSIEKDEVVGGKSPYRGVEATCGKVRVSLYISRFGVSVTIAGKHTRRFGKHFGSVALASAAYRSPEMKAIFAAVSAIKPRVTVRAECVEVSVGVAQ